MILHAGLVARRVRRAWAGVLIEGVSGAGKSDLMLRLLDDGFRLAADDRVVIWRCSEAVFGRAPDPLSGLIEGRGLGILAVEPLRLAPVVLVARCEAGPTDRLPPDETRDLAGVATPLVRLNALEASAPAKLGRALERLGSRANGA